MKKLFFDIISLFLCAGLSFVVFSICLIFFAIVSIYIGEFFAWVLGLVFFVFVFIWKWKIWQILLNIFSEIFVFIHKRYLD